MTGPTFSPDGKWMWDGNAWIPAPPQANVLPQASLNQNQISTVANNAGVPVNQLANTAPYFDQNRDGILQNSELQQAAAAIAQPPTMSVPIQQPMVQQPMVQQPMVQQPMVQQPMMQQNTMAMGQAPQQLAVISSNSKSKGKIIAAFLLVTILMGGVLYVWADNANLIDDDWDNEDYDGDGFSNSVDNCWEIFNFEQLDFDDDTYGNECDDDDDNDGVDDFTDNCDNTPENDEVDSFGCTLIPDQDNDGIDDDEDLLVSGNAGLKIYISQLYMLEGENYEQDQRWPCSDGVGSVEYSWINDGVSDCQDGSDENTEAGSEGVNWRIPDFTYNLRVDWNCDEIYDASIDIADNDQHYTDAGYINNSLNSATIDDVVLSNDIPDNLDNICLIISVYDQDIVTQDQNQFDINSLEGLTSSFSIPLETIGNDYTLNREGSDDDDSSNPNPDVGVSIRFLIYEI